jgi:bifunctional non-homologous end joining protein LigD
MPTTRKTKPSGTSRKPKPRSAKSADSKSITPRTSRSAAADDFPYRLTHPERVVYPDVGITKGDVARYYLAVGRQMLPHVCGRLLTMVRCPEGVGGACFYQKHPPTGLPDVVRRVRVREKSEWDTYLVIDDLEGLMALVQFGALEIHVWGSQASDMERPNQLVFDLDPAPDVAWKEVVEAALLLKKVLGELGFLPLVKTTGGKGLHVVVPIEPRGEWDDVKAFCRSVAEFLVRFDPSRFVANMSKAKRRGKIFVDYLRNDRGSTAIAPYSTRARPGAPISVPVDWRKLRALDSGSEFTVENGPSLAKRSDPWKGFDSLRRPITAKARKSLAE